MQHFNYLNDGPADAALQSAPIATPENIKISPRRRRISQYFQSAEAASSLSLPELLQEAELELVDTTAQNVPMPAVKRSFPVYSPFPMPGSWSGINTGSGSPFRRGRIDCAQWTIADWQDLERCYKRLYKKRVRTSSANQYVWTFEDGTEVIDDLCKLKRITKAELRDEWSRYVRSCLILPLLTSTFTVKHCVYGSTPCIESASRTTSRSPSCLLSPLLCRDRLSVLKQMTLASWICQRYPPPRQVRKGSRVS